MRRHNRKDPNAVWMSLDRKTTQLGGERKDGSPYANFPNSFGLPSGHSCPGKTEFCRSCYAVNSERSPGVSEGLWHNFVLLKRAGNKQAMAMLLYRMVFEYCQLATSKGLNPWELIFRLHWDGDFFSETYAQAWALVMRAFPQIRFFVYTRSFIDGCNVVPILAGIPNLKLFLSEDEYNLPLAMRLKLQYGDAIDLALCAEDYSGARELFGGDEAKICPENEGLIALMQRNRGACIICRYCFSDHGKNVIFSTSHQYIANPQLELPFEEMVLT